MIFVFKGQILVGPTWKYLIQIVKKETAVTIKRMFISWMYRQVAHPNGSGAAAGCCASSRQRGGSLRWSGGTCGPCPGRGSSFPRMSTPASLCACAQALWSIGCLGYAWWLCGRGRSESPRKTCRWSLHPPSRSWELSGLHSDDQHAPTIKKKKKKWVSGELRTTPKPVRTSCDDPGKKMSWFQVKSLLKQPLQPAVSNYLHYLIYTSLHIQMPEEGSALTTVHFLPRPIKLRHKFVNHRCWTCWSRVFQNGTIKSVSVAWW